MLKTWKQDRNLSRLTVQKQYDDFYSICGATGKGSLRDDQLAPGSSCYLVRKPPLSRWRQSSFTASFLILLTCVDSSPDTALVWGSLDSDRLTWREKNKRRCLAALASPTSTDVEPWQCDYSGPVTGNDHGVDSFPFKSMLACVCVSMCRSVNAARALQKKCTELAAVEATVSEQKGFGCLPEPHRQCSRQQISILHPVFYGA